MLRACVGPFSSETGVRLLKRVFAADGRGHVEELSLDFPSTRSLIVMSKRKVIRGMHFQDQSIAPLTKAITVLEGHIEEFVFDLRIKRPGAKFRLDEQSPTVVVPPWCAHGYAVISERAVVQYHFDGPRVPEAERIIRWNSLPIIWPFNDPILSEKDSTAPPYSAIRH